MHIFAKVYTETAALWEKSTELAHLREVDVWLTKKINGDQST
jgi:hypothetical protein